MKMSKMLANITPACRCGEYYVEGQKLHVIRGVVLGKWQWWIGCPLCDSTLGQSFDYPITTSKAALLKRGYKDESNSNA